MVTLAEAEAPRDLARMITVPALAPAAVVVKTPLELATPDVDPNVTDPPSVDDWVNVTAAPFTP